MLERTACPHGCAGDHDRLVVRGRDRIHDIPGMFNVVRCGGCGLMRTDPRPTPETIGAYYPPEYSPHLSPPPEAPLRRRRGRFLSTWLARLADPRSQLTPERPPGRLVEVGCGSGRYLGSMRDAGWDVSGIEPSEAAAERVRRLGLSVEVARAETAVGPDRPCDLIVAWMAVEHFHDPLAALLTFRSWSTPDGVIALSVPNAGALEFRVFRDAWYALHLPCHLFHFTPRTVTQLLDAAGWTVTDIHHHRNLGNAVASLGYRVAERFGDSRLSRALIGYPESLGRPAYVLAPAAALAARCGQTGRMTVWARRSD